MKIKKGDQVKILAGKDRGKSGKILQIINHSTTSAKVIVEGLNLRFKHLRPKRGGEKGQRIMFPAPLDISKVQLVCPRCGKNTRIAYRLITDGELAKEKKQRLCKKCQSVI
ncbi:MAG TPA: 50S ribosomal protein L24 [bacterium]|nr:50S ribosomal protein L24 [bacterium]HPL95889.1 50S ribosomal protein L24 [bacterium]